MDIDQAFLCRNQRLLQSIFVFDLFLKIDEVLIKSFSFEFSRSSRLWKRQSQESLYTRTARA